MIEVIELYRRASDEFLARVREIQPDDWTRQTPCADWDVRILVHHVVEEQRWVPPLLAGATIDEVGDTLSGDLLGADAGGSAQLAAAEAEASVQRDRPPGGKVHLSYGDEDPDEYVRQLVADHLVHGWDLAVAIGADTKFDRDLVHEVAAWFTDREDVYRASGAIASRPPEVSADPQDQLLLAFGRDPRWRRPDALGDNIP
jgi:uncharacterized protein (TIGR03086 family)